MRHQSSITSLSWIPSEAVEGSARVAFDKGLAHYDPPPPAKLTDIDELCEADRFRFANVLSAWVDVDRSGEIADCGYSGGGLMGSTTIKVGPLARTFEAVGLPDIQHKPERGDGFVRFVQTAGGRTGVPAPRRVRRKPFVQWQAPLVWTTLSLTIHADGRAEGVLDRSQPLPAPLDLRRHRAPLPQVRAGGLQGLVSRLLRAPHPLGRPGLARARDRCRDHAREAPLRTGDERRQQAEHPRCEARHDARAPGRRRLGGVPPARRRAAGGARRRALGRVWPRSAARRARAP